MEQYFEITRESKEYDNYFKYLAEKESCRIAVNEFFNGNNIASDKYKVAGGKLWIEDTSESREKFESQLAKYSENGMIAFKKNSQIGRAWSALNVNPPIKPFVPFFFQGAFGQVNTRLFNVGDKVYCSIKSVGYEVKYATPIGFIEMKASEFFKIIEDNS